MDAQQQRALRFIDHVHAGVDIGGFTFTDRRQRVVADQAVLRPCHLIGDAEQIEIQRYIVCYLQVDIFLVGAVGRYRSPVFPTVSGVKDHGAVFVLRGRLPAIAVRHTEQQDAENQNADHGGDGDDLTLHQAQLLSTYLLSVDNITICGQGGINA